MADPVKDHSRIDADEQRSFDFIQKYINAGSVERAPAEEMKLEKDNPNQHALSF